jgi:hypothetical protein
MSVEQAHDESVELAAEDQPEVTGDPPGQGEKSSVPPRRPGISGPLGRLIREIGRGNDAEVQEVVLQLSRRNRLLAPLTLAVGAIGMLYEGVRLLFSNWRLMLIQLLPAMLIWLGMFDLKVHLLHGKSFHVIEGLVLIPILLALGVVTAASFFLNAMFAFSVAKPGPPNIRASFGEARTHLFPVLGSGFFVGLMLGFSTVVVTRWGGWWFAISLSIVLAVMMTAYVAVPARLIGLKSAYSKRDKLTVTAVGGTVGAAVCTPPYLLGRLGYLMLGSHILFIPGILVLTVAAGLQAGATSAVKTVKLSAKLVAGRRPGSPIAVKPGQAMEKD